MKLRVFLLLVFLFSSLPAFAQSWTAKLDKDIRFYQPTEMGVVIAGTEKSLYAIDASNGEVLWRRKDTELDETDVAPVPGTDLLLLSFEKGDKARIEAVDVLTGNSIWRSEKIKGAVMQISVDPETNLLAVVLAKDAKNRARDGFKRRPLLHVLDLASGDELWKYEVGEVEMMPARWPEDSGKDVDYTLDNYYPPAFTGDRLYVFYEGVTSFDARSGKERLREKYRVNEDGLALTEAEPIFTESSIFVSGHGRVRAISRKTGDTEWEAKDLGLTPEMIIAGDVLYVRTGGQFTRIKDGETIERGSYGVSAIDTNSGKVLWRYKGADKGITNLLLPDRNTIAIADRDDLIFVDTRGPRPDVWLIPRRNKHKGNNLECNWQMSFRGFIRLRPPRRVGAGAGPRLRRREVRGTRRQQPDDYPRPEPGPPKDVGGAALRLHPGLPGGEARAGARRLSDEGRDPEA